MKLTTSQISEIEYFLTTKGLVHLDVRMEILDHMCENITQSMDSERIDFEKAFQKEIENWKYDLSEHSSFWLGIIWLGPRIVIDTCVKKTKAIYLRLLLYMVIVGIGFYMFKNKVSIGFLSALEDVIGVLYILLFGMLLFFHFKIKSTGYQTSYSFLFKINAVGFGIFYTLYNPLWADFIKIIPNGTLSYMAICSHLLFLGFSYYFYEFYKGHMANKKNVIL